jgi:threonine-phosphate decarboxylase
LNLIKRAKDTVFVIDEAFIDFAEEETLIYHAKDLENVIVLRSLTKFYGLAGLRFGYGVSQKKLIEKLKNFSQPWNVNTLAQVAGTEIIKHKEFKRKSLDFFKQEKEFLEGFFYKKGIVYYPSVANFYLLKLPNGGFVKYVLEKGILVRDCSNFYGLDDRFIRISVKTRPENERILRELENWLNIKKAGGKN